MRLKYPTSFLAPLLGNGSCSRMKPSFSKFSFSFTTFLLLLSTNNLNSTPIYQYATPKSTSLEPLEPMTLTSSYELCPCLVAIGPSQTLEVENNGDFNKQEIFFINTPSVFCSYEKSPDSLSLSNIAPHEIFNPLMPPIPKVFERLVVDTCAYYKYFRSRCGES